MLDVSSGEEAFRRSIRLVIADRQPIVLQGLKSVFAAQRDFDIVAACSTGTSCLEAIRKLAPDVALVADGLLDLTASEILAIAKAERLPTRLVLFTESEADDLAAAGACSAISKYAPPDAMLRTLRLMTEDISTSPEPSQERSPNGKAIDAAKIDKMLGLLTQRESQIVRLVSEGLSNKEIARQLDVSQGTVKVHLHNIFQKLEISNRTVLATIALLQRPAGFGTLSLAAFAFAILDDVKALESNGTFPDDDGGADRDSDKPEFEIWKKAILRHTVVADSSDTAALAQRGSAIKVSQVATPASRIEQLHAAEQAILHNGGRSYGPIGSSTPGLLVSPLLQAINNSRPDSPAGLQQLPPLESVTNPARSHGGYGAFTMTAAGALVGAIEHANAAVQAPRGETLVGSSVLASMDASTQMAALTFDGERHVASSEADGLAPTPIVHEAESRLASAPPEAATHAGAGNAPLDDTGAVDAADGGSGNDTIAGNGGRDTLHEGAIAGGNDAPAGSHGEDVLVYRPAKESSSTRFDTIISGANQINLAALGALAFLQLTSTSTSVPPHTLAWIYDPITNETIVYVNPTDRSLDIGDSSLLEIRLQGVVSAAEADVAGEPDATAVAAALEGIDPALLETVAGDGIVLTSETAYASIETEPSEHAHATAAIWTMPADDGFKFQFARDRINSTVSTSGLANTAEKPAYATELSGTGAVDVPVHVSSIELPQNRASVLTEEKPASGQEPAHANSGSLTTAHATAHAAVGLQTFESAIVTPVAVAEPAAPGNSGGHGNSQHGSNKAKANTAEAAAPVETSAAPGNSGGHGNSQHGSNKAKADAAEAPGPIETSSAPGNSGGHGNSQHESNKAKANAAEAADPVETSAAFGNSGGHGNSQHGSNKAKANAAEAPGPVETSSAPGNSGGHSNSQHESNKAKADAAEAAAPVETSAAPGNSGDHGNSQHASNKAKADAAEATAPVETTAAPGNSGGHSNSQHASNKAKANAAEATAPVETTAAPGNSGGHGNSQHESNKAKADAAEAAAPVETSAAPGNSGNHGNSQHASNKAAANITEPAEPIEPSAATGHGGGNGHSQQASFHFHNQAMASAPTETVALEELKGSPVLPGPAAELAAILEVGPPAVEVQAAGHGNNGHGPHHATGHSSHDLLT